MTPDHDANKILIEQYRTFVPPYSLPYRVKLLSQAFMRRFQSVLEPFQVTPAYYGVLCCLWEEDGLPTIAISQRLEQLGGTFTAVLDGMERQELLYRERDKSDRRVYRVWLTPKGRELRAVLLPQAKQLAEDLYSPLSAEELALFSDMVDRLYVAVSRESGTK